VGSNRRGYGQDVGQDSRGGNLYSRAGALHHQRRGRVARRVKGDEVVGPLQAPQGAIQRHRLQTHPTTALAHLGPVTQDLPLHLRRLYAHGVRRIQPRDGFQKLGHR